MKRSLLFAVGLLLLVLGTSGAAGGPGQDEPFVPQPAPEEFTLAVGDQIRVGRVMMLQAVRHNGVVGAYFSSSSKNVSVFYADGHWATDVQFPEGTGKMLTGRGGDLVKLEGSATRCRINSSRGGALCRPRGAVFTGACKMEVAGKKITFLRFKPLPENIDENNIGELMKFERCSS